jgi:hypothetical protein
MFIIRNAQGLVCKQFPFFSHGASMGYIPKNFLGRPQIVTPNKRSFLKSSRDVTGIMARIRVTVPKLPKNHPYFRLLNDASSRSRVLRSTSISGQ